MPLLKILHQQLLLLDVLPYLGDFILEELLQHGNRRLRVVRQVDYRQMVGLKLDPLCEELDELRESTDNSEFKKVNFLSVRGAPTDGGNKGEM